MTLLDERQLAAEDIRSGDYGSKVATIEPGGAEFIPLRDRHGSPRQLLWTWASPNFEFATIFVGVIGVSFFGLSFYQTCVGILVGTALGSLTHGVLSARGPRYGVPQMILSRLSFGHWGNVLPAGLNAVTAGIGWFAVNSVSGALALNTLFGLPKVLSLIIIVAAQLGIAFFGHNLVQAFEKVVFPLLLVVFGIATVITLSKSHPGHWHGTGGTGGFLLTVGSCFGYAAGWNPYASDYTRYLPAEVSRRSVGLCAGLGVFLSCLLLEVAGAASATIVTKSSGNPTGDFTSSLPTAIADLTLLAIALGAVSANVLNVYSGAMSFVSLGLRLPLGLRRAISAAGLGTIGFVVAIYGLDDAGEKYENFLLVIAYWIGPWLGVFLIDQFIKRRQADELAVFDRGRENWPGPVAMALGMAISIWLFSNQTKYVGLVAKHHPAIGDITFEVGFVVSAVVYAVLMRLRQPKAIVLPA